MTTIQTTTDAVPVLEPVITMFITRVYRCGLYDRIDACASRGMSGQFGTTMLRSYVIAGRVMLTFSRGDCQVTLLAALDDDDGTMMGLHTLRGTADEALAMLDEVIRLWPGMHRQYRADETAVIA